MKEKVMRTEQRNTIKKTRICIISDAFPPTIGGIENATYELAKHLSEDERVGKVAIITFNRELSGREIVNNKFEILRLKIKSKRALLLFMEKGVKLLYHLLRKRNYDVFHAITVYSSGFFISIFNKFFLHKKAIVTIHGRDALRGFKDWKVRFIIRMTFWAINKIIFVSDASKDRVAKLYKLGEKKIVRVYYGVAFKKVNPEKVNELREKYRLDETDFVVLFLGRLAAKKCVDVLIRAVHNLPDDVKLLIVGDGPEREKLMKLRRDWNLEERVVFTGSVLSTTPYYKLADVFCTPSKYWREEGDIEALGLVFLEAQSCGIPVIGTNSGGIPEAIDNNKSGFVVPEGDFEAIEKKIIELKNNNDLCNRMGEEAIKFVSEKFSWERCVDEHIKLYQE